MREGRPPRRFALPLNGSIVGQTKRCVHEHGWWPLWWVAPRSCSARSYVSCLPPLNAIALDGRDMDRRLSKLIKDYQRRVADAVAMLEAAGIPRPLSNMAWTESDDFGRVSLPNGFSAYKHGVGCSVDGPEWGVDFDFGASGQIDGFDAWRLHDFARRRLREYEFSSEKDIETAVRLAAEAGELAFSGYILYYVTDAGRRAV